jgi:hypothetical protein
MIRVVTMNDPRGANWTPDAIAVIRRACDHHGGFDAWRALQTIRLIPDRFSGLLPRLKGAGRTFPIPVAFEVVPHDRVARFVSYPDAHHVGIFDNGSVAIQRLDDRRVIAESRAHRSSFHGLAANRRWTPLDALYFFGYALTHYHSLPFSLLDARLLALRVSGTRRDPLDVVEVELPVDLPTHCRRQAFYFDRSGRLIRPDYHAEVVGFWARGAHFWNRQLRVGGFPIAMDRHVMARLRNTPMPLTALRATFKSAEVETA